LNEVAQKEIDAITAYKAPKLADVQNTEANFGQAYQKAHEVKF
jgi:hypothetical protein